MAVVTTIGGAAPLNSTLGSRGSVICITGISLPAALPASPAPSWLSVSALPSRHRRASATAALQ